MLVWINGPFGVGKTHAAYGLARRLPQSFVCDPEQLGFGLQRMTPPEYRGDFQDITLWREGVRRMLDRNLSHFSGVIVVPMTLVNPAYFDEIVGQLRRDGHTVHHIALLASPPTVHRRLRSRGEGSDSWGATQLDRCLRELTKFDPSEQLVTDHLNHRRVVEAIARRSGLTLSPDTRRPWQVHWERLKLRLQSARGD